MSALLLQVAQQPYQEPLSPALTVVFIFLGCVGLALLLAGPGEGKR